VLQSTPQNKIPVNKFCYYNCSSFLYYKLRDILITQKAVLSAMLDFSKIVKATRGSALYYDAEGEKCVLVFKLIGGVLAFCNIFFYIP